MCEEFMDVNGKRYDNWIPAIKFFLYVIELEFSEHAKLKIEERNISSSEISTVLRTPSAVFLDVETEYFIAIGRASKPDHYLIVVYVVQKDKVKVITIIDTTKMEMVKRRE